MKKKLGRISTEKALIFMCNIQPGFIKDTYKGNYIALTARQMAKTADILKIPILVSEQEVDDYGNTLCEIQNNLPKNITKQFANNTFSMVSSDSESFLRTHKDRNIAILLGFETHVCVQQTCLDLLERNYDVHLLVDGTSSMFQLDRDTAFQRMRDAGAFITTYQNVIFELIQHEDHPEFQNLQPTLEMKDDKYIHDHLLMKVVINEKK